MPTSFKYRKHQHDVRAAENVGLENDGQKCRYVSELARSCFLFYDFNPMHVSIKRQRDRTVRLKLRSHRARRRVKYTYAKCPNYIITLHYKVNL